MTTASDIIKSAYREGNLLSINSSPTTAQQAEGLVRLNSLLIGSFGQEVGNELADLTIGGEYDQSYAVTEFVPENARLVVDIATATTFKLHPMPYDGQRLAFADVGGNISTHNITLDANGRRIEDAATVTLMTNFMDRQWFYRADLAQWVRLTGLTETDNLPFPIEFDDYFIILLAMRLNPRYGQELQTTSAQWLESMANRLEARYRRPRRIQDWPTLGLLGQREQPYGGSFYPSGRGWL